MNKQELIEDLSTRGEVFDTKKQSEVEAGNGDKLRHYRATVLTGTQTNAVQGTGINFYVINEGLADERAWYWEGELAKFKAETVADQIAQQQVNGNGNTNYVSSSVVQFFEGKKAALLDVVLLQNVSGEMKYKTERQLWYFLNGWKKSIAV